MQRHRKDLKKHSCGCGSVHPSAWFPPSFTIVFLINLLDIIPTNLMVSWCIPVIAGYYPLLTINQLGNHWYWWLILMVNSTSPCWKTLGRTPRAFCSWSWAFSFRNFSTKRAPKPRKPKDAIRSHHACYTKLISRTSVEKVTEKGVKHFLYQEGNIVASCLIHLMLYSHQI